MSEIRMDVLVTWEYFTKLFKPRGQRKNFKWKDIVTLDPCVYCGRRMKPSKRTREHIIPVFNNGKNGWINIVGACAGCNRSRSHDPLLMYLVNPPKSVKNFWKQVGAPFVKG